jgi:hypothetical protein
MRARDQRDRAAAPGEHRRSGVNIIGLGEEGRAAALPHNEDADDLATGDEPHRVDVMDGAVAVEATRGRDVRRVCPSQQRARQVRGHRLLAERGEASVLDARDQLAMGAGWGTDRHAVQVGPQKGLEVGRGITVKFLGRCLCSRRTGSGHDDLINGVQAPGGRGVQCPDPTDSHQANTHAQTLPTSDSDGARPRARLR